VSPDGRSLAYVEAGSPGSAAVGPLTVHPLEDGATESVSPGPVAAFEWSPDGERLLYLIVDRAAGLVAPHVWDGQMTTGFEGYVPTPLFVAQYLPFWDQYTRSLTTWSPDGTAFVYASQGSGGGEIWVQPLEGDRRMVAEGEFASWVGDPNDGGAPLLP
jgi:TolB protein